MSQQPPPGGTRGPPVSAAQLVASQALSALATTRPQQVTVVSSGTVLSSPGAVQLGKQKSGDTSGGLGLSLTY